MNPKQEIDIEKLVTWALGDQGLGWTGRDSLSGMLDLGTRVDRSLQGSGLPPPSAAMADNEDAWAVHEAIHRLPVGAASLVVQYGRIGARPDWAPQGYGHVEQARNANGTLKWVYENPNNRRSRRWPVMDFEAYAFHCERVEHERATWTAWREALRLLAEALGDGRLAFHRVTGPLAPSEPWAGQAGPDPVPPEFTMAFRRAAANPAYDRPGIVG
ncbi:MAG: hypothetical protein H6873_05575 [Hyphomicrobiaceae bacterium]|nr:hypothetical protein [Hyphomicrobiaceae bacterium]